MHGLRSDVIVVSDGQQNADAVVASLRDFFNLRQESLTDCRVNGDSSAYVTLFCVNAGVDDSFEKLKNAVKASEGEKLFILPTHNSKSVDRIKDLGGADYMVLPVPPRELHARVKKAINRRVERAWAALDPTSRTALKSSLACFEDCFSRVQNGEVLPMEMVQSSCRSIRDSAQIGTLGGWIDALENHHNYSFRHSMFVCGTITYFANAIGIAGSDLQLLTVGGLLHDIGKSNVPLEMLDKPGKLEPHEWDIMRQHPEYSREILLREQGLDPNAVAMAVHHHEKLDGSGYPDGLSGAEISDHVRLMAIADVYAALIDKRSYKEAMSKEDAIKLMGKFKGHLDMDLLRTFRSYMLDSR